MNGPQGQMSKYQELLAEIARLKSQAEEVRQKELDSVIAEIKEKISEYSLTAADLGLIPSRRGSAARKMNPLPPKYRNPKTDETWSGRGKPPKWIAGKTKERFLIK